MPRPRQPLFSPLARKRYLAFRRSRRGWWSLWLLVALFIISLATDLLCNERPLYLRLDGRNHFPFLRYRSQHALLGNQVYAPVDYRALAASSDFDRRRGDCMVWPPVPFGPRQVIHPRDLEQHRRANVSIIPDVAIGRINLTAAGRVTRSVGAESFFGGQPPDGQLFTNHWTVTPDLEAALALRLANQPDAAAAFTLPSGTNDALRVEVSLPAYEPRPEAAASVRLTLRPAEAARTRPLSLLFERRPDGRVRPAVSVPWRPDRWQSVPEAVRQRVLARVAEVYAGAPEREAETVPWNGGTATVTCKLQPVAWPYRPVPRHWLGIDAAGHDVLACILHGLRTSLNFGLLLVAWAMLLGFVIGALQGYFAGWMDLVTQRFIEIWSALPFLYVMILVGAVLGRSFGLLLLCYGLFNWIGISYYMRAEFLRLRSRPFVEAARCQGLGHGRIIFRHILPNALTPMITLLPFNLVGAISALTALDYLGFGLPPLTPSWGELLQQAQLFRHAWWLIVYPSLILFIVMLLAVLVGEGLRDAFDPKPRTRLR